MASEEYTKISVVNLSPSGNAPCFLLSFHNTTVLLDCAADLTSLLSFMPCSPIPSAFTTTAFASNLPADHTTSYVTDFKSSSSLPPSYLIERDRKFFINQAPQLNIPTLNAAQVASIDVVLISNYLMLTALPYLVRDPSFHGVILASDPTAQYGELLLEELASYCSHVSDDERAAAKQWKRYLIDAELSACESDKTDTDNVSSNVRKIPAGMKSDFASTISRWELMFSRHDAAIVGPRLRRVSHDERFVVPGSGLRITSVSSGYVIGSSNWVLESGAEKVVYLSSSSALESHVRQISYRKLYEPELLIAAQLSSQIDANIVKSLDALCTKTVAVLQEGGNVLIPLYSFGIVLDIVERLAYGMEHANLPFSNIYMISPSAKPSLAMANIFSEYLHQKRAAKTFIPEEPFIHGDLQRSGRLFCFSTLTDIPMADFRTPCVVIASHSSMRLGACVHLMRQWFADRLNTVLAVDADYDLSLAVGPYQPLAMRMLSCPLDTRLRPSDLVQVAQNLSAKHVVVAGDYREALEQQAQRLAATGAGSSTNTNDVLSRFVYLKRDEVASFDMPPAFEEAIVSGKLLQYTFSSVAQGAFSAGTFRGVMKIRNNNNEAHFMRGRDAVDELMAVNNANGAADEASNAALLNLIDTSSDVVPESKRTLLSTLNVEQLVQRLAEMGIRDAKVVRDNGGSGDTSISNNKKSAAQQQLPCAVIDMPSKGIRIVTNGVQTTCHMKDVKAQRGLRKRLIEAVCSSFDRV